MRHDDKWCTKLQLSQPGTFNTCSVAKEACLPVSARVFVKEVQERDASLEAGDVSNVWLLPFGERLRCEAQRVGDRNMGTTLDPGNVVLG